MKPSVHDEGGGGRTAPGGGNGAGRRGLAPGTVFAGLEIEAEVGRGGMGVIYRAHDPALDRVRALKILAAERSDDPAFRERFRRESKLAASIEHPNVAPVYRAGEEDGRLYLIMRFVDGPSLYELIAERGPLPPARVAAIAKQVAAALDTAHAHGLVHRDVKPGNIMLEGPEGEERAFLCDFGISRMADAATELTTTGHVLGTVDYVAPEQISGDPVDRRVDVYSLACVLFHALTGSAPFRRDTPMATLFAHANAPRPRPSDEVAGLPPQVDRVLARGMAVKPSDRFSSAGELAAHFVRALESTLSSAATTDPLPGMPRRRRLALSGAALVLVAAGVVVAILVASSSNSGSSPSAEPVAAINVPGRPVGIAVGPRRVWVATPSDGTVSSIVPGGTHVASTVTVGGEPVSVAVGFKSVWIVDRDRNSVIRMAPQSGATMTTIPVGADPSDVALTKRWVWVANRGGDTVTRIDPLHTGATTTIPVGAQPSALAAARFAVWVANQGGRSVSLVGAAGAKTVGHPIAVGQTPNDIAVGSGSVWVIDNFGGTLTRVDPETMRVVGSPIEVGAKPRGVAAGLGSVWVANGEDGTVTRIDAQTGQVEGGTIPVGTEPTDIDTGAGAVWVANFGDSTVSELQP